MVAELDVMKGLKPHPHVLKLIGCCTVNGKCKFKTNRYTFSQRNLRKKNA